MLTPLPGIKLPGASQTFWWTNVGATNHYVYVGNSLGAHDIGIYPSAGTTDRSTNVDKLPTDGRILYIRLYSAIGGAWYWHDYTYEAAAGAASILSPADGSTLSGPNQTFTWTDSHATNYQIWVGDAVGNYTFGYFPAAGTTLTSTLVTGMPTDGRTLYVRLNSQIGGNWYSNDYSYRSGP